MDAIIEIIITSVISAVGSGSLVWVATAKYTRKQAEADAMKSVQDVYQELIEDLKSDRENLKTEMGQLKLDLHNLQLEVAYMKPALCGKPDCTHRIPFDYDK